MFPERSAARNTEFDRAHVTRFPITDRRHEESAKLARHDPIADDDTWQINYLFDLAPCRFAIARTVVTTQFLGDDALMTGGHGFLKESPTGANNAITPGDNGILWDGVMQEVAPLGIRQSQE
jgi:hypothetical protein